MSSPVTFPIGDSAVLLTYSPKENYHLLEFSSPPDNRFTPKFLGAFMDALAYIQKEGAPKPLVTTSKIEKFYSNGLDLQLAMETPGFFNDYYYAFLKALLDFPWPTIAWVNGHAFAAAFAAVACHDYAVMNPNRGYLCMNELEFGAHIPAPMLSIARVRYGTPIAQRIGLRAHRFSGKEALAEKMVNALGGLPEVEEIVSQVAKFAASPSYAAIRRELFREVLVDTVSFSDEVGRYAGIQEARETFHNKRVRDYESKL